MAVVQWRGSGGRARSALPVIQGALGVVAGWLAGRAGLVERVADRRRLREVLGLA